MFSRRRPVACSLEPAELFGLEFAPEKWENESACPLCSGLLLTPAVKEISHATHCKQIGPPRSEAPSESRSALDSWRFRTGHFDHPHRSRPAIAASAFAQSRQALPVTGSESSARQKRPDADARRPSQKAAFRECQRGTQTPDLRRHRQ